MSKLDTTPEMMSSIYKKARERLAVVRKRLNRPLTLAEKVLFGHLHDPENQELAPGKAILALHPDRVVMQDATAQMAILQFMQAQKPTTAVPSTVHCDHLIRAYQGAQHDLSDALSENREVYDFLSSACNKFGIGFWKPGSGIIHQVVLENYAFPGGLIIGTDSHTPNAGGLGMVACGVGGADAVDVMVGLPWEVLHPKLIGVKLTGKMNGWTAPKDIILKVCGELTTKGGTNCIIEYFGPGTKSISCTGKATITNMGAELGATTSIFPYDPRMALYLDATERAALTKVADANLDLITADPEVEQNPSKYFDRVVEIDLDTLEPYVVGPHTPDLARPISKLKEDVEKNGYNDKISAALIGSCTNSSYEDIERSADVSRQATKAGLTMQTQFMVSPGSELVFETIRRDGQLEALEAVGGVVLSNACGPCIGQWKRDDVKMGEKNSIITSFNRNFPRRNDGNPDTMAFIASPEIVVAMGLAGRLSFNPLKDEIETQDGRKVKLEAPKPAAEVPSKGFILARQGYQEPATDSAAVNIQVDSASDRLQLLLPFAERSDKEYINMPLLLKVKGKCTTDHISPAGKWLKYRGHLDKISDNMFLAALNAFTDESGKATDLLSGEKGKAISEIARHYKSKGHFWAVVGDENYGEGSSREHAAMSPRYLGAGVVIVRSFARIHETNLKKQGVLPLTFENAKDYDKVQEMDRVTIPNLKDQLKPGSTITVELHHASGDKESFKARHSLTPEQIKWFWAGSALNLVQ
ncbi:MAG: aconitate hydratase [Deltaproteobacteria bacterium CG11_big_fil_rev_8_21_14_0_20_47_16]|nr:MAG: aconitate hydratase [Deltaproteobacteria bacterium CG11_big_fil_rev_8_21_14_0_20_47_16]